MNNVRNKKTTATLNMGDAITLTYCWYKNYEHGICGHTYEVIDYFYILSKKFNVKILLVVDFDLKYFKEIIQRKYSFTDVEVKNIIDNTVIKTYDEMLDYKRIFSRVVLVTDGLYSDHKFMTKHLLCFPCTNKHITYLNIKDLIILQDDRIYAKTKNSVNYIKKILLDKIKKPTKKSDKTLLYTTSGPREYGISRYPKDRVVCVTNDRRIEGYTYLDMPVQNIFDEFGTYIYTPVVKKFDCSPRFIVECKYFNKKVIYDIDYIDIGLEVRRKDLENIEDLTLTEDDFIIKYMKNLF